MDPEAKEVFNYILQLFPWIVAIVAISVGGWAFTTWLRIKNGYPLQSSWGLPMHPKTDQEATQRIKLLTNENVQLRAELGSVKDRLANVERIVTDDGHRLTQEIEALRVTRN